MKEYSVSVWSTQTAEYFPNYLYYYKINETTRTWITVTSGETASI